MPDEKSPGADGAQKSLGDFTAKDADAGAPSDPAFYNHPLLKKDTIGYRRFQDEIAKGCLKQSTLVVLPTGLGKTIIAAMVAAAVLEAHPDGKILFLAPTRPLVLQHLESFRRLFDIPEDRFVMLSGSVAAKKRKDLFEDRQLIFSTPQTIANDIANNVYSLDACSLIIFDECHRAVGDYSYVPIAASYSGLSLGLTASPGATRPKIAEVMGNLKMQAIEARSREDPDISGHVQEFKIEYIKVRLTAEMMEIRKHLEKVLLERVAMLRKSGFLRYKYATFVSKKDLIQVRPKILQRLNSGQKSFYLFSALMNQYLALHAHHCIELLETQGIDPFLAYMKNFDKEELSRNERIFIRNADVAKARELALNSKRISHPKITELKRLVSELVSARKDSKIIIFTQYRNTIESIMDHISAIPDVRASRFVGQASKESDAGLKQEEQRKIIGDLKEGRINVLIATSVAEEGIDIPDVDAVIFYEPVPSEIRTIQRRGRTGRTSAGRVIVLIAEGTRDEAYLRSEAKREDRMRRIVRQIGSAGPAKI